MFTVLNKFGDKLHLKSTLRSRSRGRALTRENESPINVIPDEAEAALSGISKPPTGAVGITAGTSTTNTPRRHARRNRDSDYQKAKREFLTQFPEYRHTKALDIVRDQEFARLKQGNGTVYMDYMGGCLYPETLVKQHLEQLTNQVLGNTHSDSPTSKLSEAAMSAARASVLSYFSASPDDYVCIFTPNCTGALKIVGESFPFQPPTQRGLPGSGSSFILAEDSHNSVNGIRAFAEKVGADVRYVKGARRGGFDQADMMATLRESAPRAGVESLVAITGQSNISGFRPDLLPILSEAKHLGYSTLVDAAALASSCQIVVSKPEPTSPTSPTSPTANIIHNLPTPPSSPFGFTRRSLSRPSSPTRPSGPFASLASFHSPSLANLSIPPIINSNPEPMPIRRGDVINLEGQADAIAVSFYKMFGYPTGVGALIVKKSFLAKLRKPWFAGGNVEMVGVPHGVTFSEVPYERFEDGTINYTSLSAITNGLQWLAKYTHSPLLSTRLSPLHIWLHHSLEQLKHANGMPVVRIRTHDPIETRCSKSASNSEIKSKLVGYLISCTFHRADGTEIPISHVSSRAAQNSPSISLRTGCSCNPGGVLRLLDLRDRFGPRIQRWMSGETSTEGAAAMCTPQGQCKTSNTEEPLRLADLYRDAGAELGVVRLSLGIVTNFRDVWETLKFASTFVES